MVPTRNTSWTLRECGRPGVGLRAQSGIAPIHKRGVPTRATERIRTVEQPWLKHVNNDMVTVGIYVISLQANMIRIRHMLTETIGPPPATSPRTCLIHRGEGSFISISGLDQWNPKIDASISSNTA